ncbi:MAG: flavin reductase family protein [Clostridia bacterium]
MSKIEWKGGTLLAPLPVIMVSCGNKEKSNIITIAWTGILNTLPPKTYISVRKERYSYDIIKESGEFVINLTSSNLVPVADYCGIMSGRKVDKWTKFDLHKEYSESFACPMIAESPMSIYCKVTDITPLGSHNMIIADIVSIFIDDKLIDKNDKLSLDKADLACYVHGEYFSLEKKLGSFAYTTKKDSPIKTNDKRKNIDISTKKLNNDVAKEKKSSLEYEKEKNNNVDNDVIDNKDLIKKYFTKPNCIEKPKDRQSPTKSIQYMPKKTPKKK